MTRESSSLASGDTVLAYIDESGDPGFGSSRASTTFTLGVVLVSAASWNANFNQVLEFRRRLKRAFGVPVRAEIKANYLIRGSGDLTELNLSPRERFLIYRAHMDFLANSNMKVFAVVGHKQSGQSGLSVYQNVWQTTLQRLERTTRTWNNAPLVLIHDEGENHEIRRMVRKSRRHLTAGSAFDDRKFTMEFDRLIDDPIARHSHESYFLQFADLVAYAGFRRLYEPTAAIKQVVEQGSWQILGSSILQAVTSVKYRTTPGIVEIDV